MALLVCVVLRGAERGGLCEALRGDERGGRQARRLDDGDRERPPRGDDAPTTRAPRCAGWDPSRTQSPTPSVPPQPRTGGVCRAASSNPCSIVGTVGNARDFACSFGRVMSAFRAFKVSRDQA